MMLTMLRKFCAEEGGTALLVFALALFIVIGGMAFAIDMARFLAAKSRLGIATEMAVVTATQNFRFLSAEELDQLATEIVRANFRGTDLLTYSDDTIAPPSVNLATIAETGEITLTASVEIPTSLLRALNFFDDVAVSTSISAVQEMPEAEVVLVLDSSESLGSSGRLGDVTSAATAFAGSLEAEVAQAQGIKWALVPVGNAIVNVAPHNNWLEEGAWPENLPPEGPGTTEWSGDLAEDRWCVAPRAGTAGEGDTLPGTAAFPLILTLDSEIDPDTGQPHYRNITTADCRPERIRGLADSLSLTAALGTLEGHGSTAYGRGMLWAERVLSPQWQGVWSDESGLPVAYEDNSVEKIAVLVIGTSAADAGEDTLLANSCARMKQNGITLYVIDYLAPEPTPSLLRHCATSGGHYFRVTEAASLRRAFFTIAKFMTVVRFSG